METKHILGFLAVIIIVVAGIAFFTTSTTKSVLAEQYDMPAFAQCLKDKGATFYGAFWCPHCAATKRLFGEEAVKNLPYVECSTPDMKGQLPICIDKKIQSYPTWEFTDGSRLNGELSPDQTQSEGRVTLTNLANATGCPVNALNGSVAITPVIRPAASSTPATATSTASTTSKVLLPIR